MRINNILSIVIGGTILFACLIPSASVAQVNGYPPWTPSKPVSMGSNAQDIINRTAQSSNQFHAKTAPQARPQALEELKQIMPESHPKTSAVIIQTPPPSAVIYDFPVRNHPSNAAGYQTAFSRMIQMAVDTSQFSLSEAVFMTENAFYNQRGDYAQFEQGLEQIVTFLANQMKLHGYAADNNVAKNLMLFRFFSDTLRRPDGSIYHLPVQYDFEDYRGDQDWARMFVTKLLHQNSGQCHSLPLLYLILAEQMAAEAYLAYAPEHTYVKFPLPNGGFQNIELTSRVLTTDAHILQSGFIKAEALQNRIYMQPLDQKALLSHCMTDLAQGYLWKFGYDPFAKEIIDKALELAPNNIHARLLRSDYATLRFQFVLNQIGETEPTFEQWLHRYPNAADIYYQMLRIYEEVDSIGYTEMPREAYEGWLQFMADQKGKQEHQPMFFKLEQSIR